MQQTIDTFCANLRHAIKNGEFVTIGGGIFSPKELAQVLAALTGISSK